jgi:hypothetical protein
MAETLNLTHETQGIWWARYMSHDICDMINGVCSIVWYMRYEAQDIRHGAKHNQIVSSCKYGGVIFIRPGSRYWHHCTSFHFISHLISRHIISLSFIIMLHHMHTYNSSHLHHSIAYHVTSATLFHIISHHIRSSYHNISFHIISFCIATREGSYWYNQWVVTCD